MEIRLKLSQSEIDNLVNNIPEPGNSFTEHIAGESGWFKLQLNDRGVVTIFRENVFIGKVLLTQLVDGSARRLSKNIRGTREGLKDKLGLK